MLIEDIKLEAGKSYVFKEADSADSYTSSHSRNAEIIGKYYNIRTGFTVDYIDEDGCWIEDFNVINNNEIKFFKEYVK